jgi:hypothetical protein
MRLSLILQASKGKDSLNDIYTGHQGFSLHGIWHRLGPIILGHSCSKKAFGFRTHLQLESLTFV